MTHRIKSLLIAAVLSLTAGHSTISHAQQAGPAGGPPPPPPGGGQGAPRGAPPTAGIEGMSRRESSPGPGFSRPPGGEMPPAGGAGRSREPLPGSPPDFSSGRNGTPEMVRVVPLSSVVSMVQERFNATAVKTDTVTDSGQVLYRIRLLSADKSRVWTVSVDARTGQVY